MEGRNFKSDVRFKFGFRLELLISPNSTVLMSESGRGFEIFLKESPKSEKGESDNSFEDSGKRKKVN